MPKKQPKIADLLENPEFVEGPFMRVALVRPPGAPAAPQVDLLGEPTEEEPEAKTGAERQQEHLERKAEAGLKQLYLSPLPLDWHPVLKRLAGIARSGDADRMKQEEAGLFIDAWEVDPQQVGEELARIQAGRPRPAPAAPEPVEVVEIGRKVAAATGWRRRLIEAALRLA